MCKKKFYSFGKESEFRVGAYAIETDKISIGKNVVIRPGSILFASPLTKDVQITIEDYALIGSGVHIYVSNHSFSNPNKPIYFQGHDKVKNVHIKSGSWIGSNAIILPGVTIGKNAVIGAGSVVTKSVEDNCVAVGQPAKTIRKINSGEECE